MNFSTTLNDIIHLVKENSDLCSIFSEVYVFGSVVDNLEPNDIDILLIYENISDELFRKKSKLHKALENRIGYQLDITMLSRNEEKETCFLNRLNLRYVRIK